VAALDSLVDGSPNRLGNPDVHLPVAPLTAGFPEALNALDPLQSGMALHLDTPQAFRVLPDSGKGVESERKNPFTISRIRVGKLL
jgi:hypothetical protein